MRLKLLAIVGLLVVTGAVIAVSIGVFNGGSTAATSFLTATASTTDVTDEVTATGAIASGDTYELAFGSGTTGGASGSAVTWPVTDVAVRVGDRVTEGQALATAATTDLDSEIADARLSAKSAALQLKQAKAAVDGATTTDVRRQARINLYGARAAKATADADLADLRSQRSQAGITSPGGGVVTDVAIEVGEDAPEGAAITVAAADLVVTTSVVESDVGKISVGQKATVTIDAIVATLQGTVASIAPTASEASNGSGVVSYDVEIALDAPPAAVRPGMSADVSIVTATAASVIAIPSRALSGSAGDYTVRVVAADGTTTTRSVEVGLVTSSLAEIKSGLSAGEIVVTGSSSDQNSTNQRGFLGGPAGGATTIVEGPGR